MSRPLAAGSVSLRVYPADLPPAGVVADLRAQARLAEAAGFDGCMTSEHHGGFPNYLPNPLLAATWLLEATERIWAAPSPVVLPLRAASQVAEDIAWTHARFPGRVGLGVAAGALPVDFELAGVPISERFTRHREGLELLADALAGRAPGALAGEPALACLRPGDLPLVVAAQGEPAVRRAARLGVGLLYDSLQGAPRTRELTEVYREAGGSAPCILIRRVWIGPPPTASVQAQNDRYRGYASAAAMQHWSEDSYVAGGDGAELAERLHALLAETGCDALNLRVFLAGLTPAQVAAQIERHGAETLPRLRALLADPPPARR